MANVRAQGIRRCQSGKQIQKVSEATWLELERDKRIGRKCHLLHAGRLVVGDTDGKKRIWGGAVEGGNKK